MLKIRESLGESGALLQDEATAFHAAETSVISFLSTEIAEVQQLSGLRKPTPISQRA